MDKSSLVDRGLRMAKYWSTCWICSKSFMSMSMGADDCGSSDTRHRDARK